MKSLIGSSVYERLLSSCTHEKQSPMLLQSIANQCVSITCQYLNSSGSITVSLSFMDSAFLCAVEFVACDNVLSPLECDLGWDFFTLYSLQLTVLGDSYSLVGHHGSTPIIPWEPVLGPLSCNSSVSSSTSWDGISPAFEQSTSQGPTTLTLVNSFSLPGRSECIVGVKTPRGYSDQ